MEAPASELADAVYSILEPNAQFISRGADEKLLHFVPPEVLETLAWLSLNICPPIVTGAASALLWEKFGSTADRDTKFALDVQRKALSDLKESLSSVMSAVQRVEEVNSRQIELAQQRVSDLLVHNGWPKKIAFDDAVKIVDDTCQKLQSLK